MKIIAKKMCALSWSLFLCLYGSTGVAFDTAQQTPVDEAIDSSQEMLERDDIGSYSIRLKQELVDTLEKLYTQPQGKVWKLINTLTATSGHTGLMRNSKEFVEKEVIPMLERFKKEGKEFIEKAVAIRLDDRPHGKHTIRELMEMSCVLQIRGALTTMLPLESIDNPEMLIRSIAPNDEGSVATPQKMPTTILKKIQEAIDSQSKTRALISKGLEKGHIIVPMAQWGKLLSQQQMEIREKLVEKLAGKFTGSKETLLSFEITQIDVLMSMMRNRVPPSLPEIAQAKKAELETLLHVKQSQKAVPVVTGAPAPVAMKSANPAVVSATK